MTTTNSDTCSICGQEFNPPNHVCKLKQVTHANSTVNTGAYTHDIKSEIIRERDKWWVEQVENIFYNAQQPPHCWQGIDCGTECPRCVYSDWQQLKREVGQ